MQLSKPLITAALIQLLGLIGCASWPHRWLAEGGSACETSDICRKYPELSLVLNTADSYPAHRRKCGHEQCIVSEASVRLVVYRNGSFTAAKTYSIATVETLSAFIDHLHSNDPEVLTGINWADVRILRRCRIFPMRQSSVITCDLTKLCRERKMNEDVRLTNGDQIMLSLATPTLGHELSTRGWSFVVHYLTFGD